jgi:transposase
VEARVYRELREGIFRGDRGKKEEPVNLEALYAKIGQLEMERDFLKKA